jgi:hypothetical protein
MDSESASAPRRVEVTVQHNPEARTYEARVGSEVAGVLVYEHSAGRTVLTHTIVEPQFRGKGVGSELVRVTLDALRDEGAKVTNYCRFVQGYIVAHPEYRVVLDAANPGLPSS